MTESVTGKASSRLGCVNPEDSGKFPAAGFTACPAVVGWQMQTSDGACAVEGEHQGDELPKTFTCQHCGRGFTTKRGLSVHSARTHKIEYNQELAELVRSGKSGRWTDAEEQAVATAEAHLVYFTDRLLTSKEIERELVGRFPSRTEEAIRCRRKQAQYKTRVENVTVILSLEEDQDSATEGNSREGGTSAGQVPHPVLAQLTAVLKGMVGNFPAIAFSLRPHSLQDVLENSAVADECFLRFQESLVRKPAPGRAGAGKKRSGKRKKSDNGKKEKGNRAQEGTKPERGQSVGEGSCTQRARKPYKQGSRNHVRAQRFRRCQTAWCDSRTKVANEILAGGWGQEKVDNVSVEDKRKFWKATFETQSCPDRRPVQEKKSDDALSAPISKVEVEQALKDLKRGTAPGPDGVKADSLTASLIPQITFWFNVWLVHGRGPEPQYTGRTTLIPKTENPKDASEFRPITVGPILTRLFHRLLAKRMESIELSTDQRGFRRVDGVMHNISIAKALLTRARSEARPLCLAFLDIRKAFDSVSHESLMAAAKYVGIPPLIRRYIENMYQVAATTVEGEHIRLKRGVMQGCPLSGLLFNCVLEYALRAVDPELGIEIGGRRVPFFLFADDMVLVSISPQAAQMILESVVAACQKVGLTFNPAKCASLQLASLSKQKKSVLMTEPYLEIGGIPLRALDLREAYRYLGVPIGVDVDKKAFHKQLVNKLGQYIDYIKSAPLRPQQRGYVLRVHALPAVVHSLVLGDSTNRLLERLDKMVRRAVRAWYHLPSDTPVGYFHANVKDGGLGFPSLAHRIPRLRYERVARLKDCNDPVVRAIAGWKCVEQDWSRLKLASVTNTLTNEVVIADSASNERECGAQRLYASRDGQDLRGFAEAGPASSRWVLDPPDDYPLSGRNYLRALHVRGNLVATPERSRRGRANRGDGKCTRCGSGDWCGASHVLQQCGAAHDARCARHNMVCRKLGSHLRRIGWQVFEEPVIKLDPRSQGNETARHAKLTDGLKFLKPDLVAVRNGEGVCLDPQIHSCRVSGERIVETKVSKYDRVEIRDYAVSKGLVAGGRWAVQGVPISWRGSMLASTERVLKALGLSRAALSALIIDLLNAEYDDLRAFIRDTRTNTAGRRQRSPRVMGLR